MVFGSDLTQTQRCIVRTANRNPDMNDRQIAEKCGCSTSHVSQTLREHGGIF